eukprot:g5431.t1
MHRRKKTNKERSEILIKCREQLRSIRQFFPPPDQDVFQLLVSFGVGINLLSNSLDPVSTHEIMDYFTKEPEINLETLNELNDWHLSASLAYDVDDGGGFLWEVLQSAILLYNQLQELDETSSLYTQFLMILAKCMEEDEVHDKVTTVLTQSIAFQKSDPKARALVISTSFQLVDIMFKRDMDSFPVLNWIHGVLNGLHQEVMSIQRCLLSQLSPYRELPYLPRDSLSIQDHSRYLKMLREADQDLMELIMIHIQRLLCTGLQSRHPSSLQMITMWFNLVPEFLHDIRPAVQICALNIVLVGLHVNHKDFIVQTLQSLEDSAVPGLENYLHCYLPQRVGRMSTQTELHEEVLDLVVRLLGEIHGFCFLHALRRDWTEITEYCLRPYSLHSFSEKANSLHRNFLYLYLTSVLRIALNQENSGALDLRFCLYFWFRQILEPKGNCSGLGFTLVLNRVFQLVGLDIYMDCIQQDSHSSIQKLTRCFFRDLIAQENGSEIALFIISKLHLVFSVWEKELKIDEQIKYLTKVSAVVSTLMKVNYCPIGSSLECSIHSIPLLESSIQQILLHQYFTWVLRSVIYLENNHSNNLDVPGLLVTPLVYLYEMMDCFIGRFFAHGIDASVSWSKIIHLISTAFLKVPFTQTGASSVDLEIMDCFVSSLEVPDHQQESFVSDETIPAPLADQYQKIGFLHFFLRNCFWNLVEKASNGSVSAERVIVNGLYLIKSCISRPWFQDTSVLLRLIPCLLSPFARILKSDSSRDLSNSCKLPLFVVLSKLLMVSLELLPTPPLDCNHLEIKGSVELRGGPLQTGDPADREKVEKGFGILLTLSLRSVLSIVRYLLPDHILANIDSSPVSSTCYKPITKLDAIDAQASFSVLFGHCWKAPWIEQAYVGANQELEGLNFKGKDPAEFEPIAMEKVPEMVFSFLRNLATLSPTTARWTAPIIHPLNALFNTRCPLLSHLRTPFRQVEDAVRSSGIALLKTEQDLDPIKQEMT